VTPFDYVVLTAVALSVLLGALRGMIREVIHLGGWIAALLLALGFARTFSASLPEELAQPELRLAAAFAILFLGTLLVTSALALVLGELVKSAGLGLADRLLGAGFGFARGFALVLGCTLLAGLTTLPQERYWKNALLSPPLEAAAMLLVPLLPEELGDRIRYR
jgi:membrane protein required for colicin V production